ncbi:MAG: hypothetical protein M3020_02875 [Myxococcota bacterium]|nr:hypothetical protein [Myxococcota bacterium]
MANGTRVRAFDRLVVALAVAAALGACGKTRSADDDDESSSGGSTAEAGAADAGAPDGVGGATSQGGATSNRGGTPPVVGGTSAGGASAGAGPTTPPTTGGTPEIPLRLERIAPQSPSKLDVLFMIDNSRSMADKQAVLQGAIPRFVQRLIAPPCVDEAGVQTGEFAANGQCSNGVPEYTPIRDIHFGIVTSSLGDMGSGDACTPGVARLDDKGWLLPSVREGLTSYEDQGFLSWDPDGQKDPPGTADASQLVRDFTDQVTAVGEAGCGYEATLEAWYRFLIDPEPPELVTKGTNEQSIAVSPSKTLLAQRAAFLRPDSVVAVVMLTDENDCSIIDYGQGWIVGRQQGGSFFLPRATSACSVDPNDECCFSCSSSDAGVPAGCTPPANDAECQKGQLPMAEDHPNLRCFQQKRRFGFDLLQPISRYVAGLTEPRIVTRSDKVVQNPLFDSPSGIPMRDRSMVFLAGIVGVPWQDISDEASWESGGGLRLLSYDELVAQDRWSWILGTQSESPLDGLMFESDRDRTTLMNVPQAHPAGSAVGGRLVSSRSTARENPINGHEADIQDGSDLQVACMFERAAPLDCDQAEVCDCKPDDELYNRGYCEGNLQTHARAYPSVRQLEVLRSVGEVSGNAVVASVCPKYPVSEEPGLDADYGYTPALTALSESMKKAFHAECLTEPLEQDTDGRTECRLLDITRPEDGRCACDDDDGRFDPGDVSLERARLGDTGELCICEVYQYEGAELEACRNQLAEPAPVGFCYVDPEPGPGEAPDSTAVQTRRALVANCPPTARHLLRLSVGVASPEANLFLSCR